MKCQSCVAKITDTFKQAGYHNVSVTLNPPQLMIESDNPPARARVEEILKNAGDYALALHENEHMSSKETTSIADSEEKLTPLFVILSYIAGGVLLRAWISDDYSFPSMMNNFMGGFLVVFSLFKLLNLSGFADAFATYDIIAARSRFYAIAYPFIELTLGIGYLISFQPLLINSTTLLVMAIGSIGVYQALRSKRKFQCACLGTSLKLPMTKVTLVEDLAMGVMALIMIVHSYGL